VRGRAGQFLYHATRQQAEAALNQGIARPIGRTCVKYLVVKRNPPQLLPRAEDCQTVTGRTAKIEHRWQTPEGRFPNHPYRLR